MVAACAGPTPQVIEKEVVVEKPVVQTVVVEKEKVVEKPVVETVIVEKEKVVEKTVVVEVEKEVTVEVEVEAPGLIPVSGEKDVNNLFATIEDYESATGKTIDTFGESPMLAALVESGELPPVEGRLPKDPAVIRPRDFIGQYGGEFRLPGFYEEGGAFNNLLENSTESLLSVDASYDQFHANVAKDWELAEDSKSLTIYLREGMKWSDGDDFNADDFALWYEILQDPDLTPSISRKWMPGGELMGFKVIDDLTVQYTFAEPFYVAVEQIGTESPFAPEHFVKQYMPKYNDDAEALAEQEGHETWQLAVQYHTDDKNYTYDLLAPQLRPWILKELGPDSAVWERNPYYFKVDTAGNQLPYMDTVLHLLAEDIKSVAPVKAMAGEYDLATETEGLSVTDYPVLKGHEEDGKYTTYLWENRLNATAMSLCFNYTHKDPILREIFNDIRFRQAMSLAIDREEISESIFYGLTRPWTAPVSAVWTGYEDWMGTYYAQHDVETANALLDEMGLEWDDAHEYRLRPDGKPLFILGEYCTEWLPYSEDLFDLIALQWKDIGVQFEPKFVFEDTLQTAAIANETSMGFERSTGSELRARADYPIRLMPPWHWASPGCDVCSPVARLAGYRRRRRYRTAGGNQAGLPVGVGMARHAIRYRGIRTADQPGHQAERSQPVVLRYGQPVAGGLRHQQSGGKPSRGGRLPWCVAV
jgi:peptide/nickel transport system substrate-binding protein